MSVKVIGTIMTGMIVHFGAKSKMLAGFFDQSFINGKRKRLCIQKAWNSPDYFGNSNVIPEKVIIGICSQCIVKRIKGGVGQSGNHVAVCKAYRAENVQGQNGND